jgi:hypothetical protein
MRKRVFLEGRIVPRAHGETKCLSAKVEPHRIHYELSELCTSDGGFEPKAAAYALFQRFIQYCDSKTRQNVLDPNTSNLNVGTVVGCA